MGDGVSFDSHSDDMFDPTHGLVAPKIFLPFILHPLSVYPHPPQQHRITLSTFCRDFCRIQSDDEGSKATPDVSTDELRYFASLPTIFHFFPMLCCFVSSLSPVSALAMPRHMVPYGHLAGAGRGSVGMDVVSTAPPVLMLNMLENYLFAFALVSRTERTVDVV